VYCTPENGRLRLLKEAIESIRHQQYPNYEHIIVDDGSTIDLKKEISMYPNISYHRLPHTGIIDSTKVFNHGLTVATGDYLIYLPSDDRQIDNALNVLASYLDTHPDKGMVAGSARMISMNGRAHIWNHFKKRPLAQNLKKRNVVHGCTVMFRKSLIPKITLPPDSYGFVSDYGLWCELSVVAKWGIIDNVVVNYRHVRDSTRNKTKKDMAYKKLLISRVQKFSASKIR